MTLKDYYQVLCIDKDASQEDIKRAFRRLAMRYHPDRNPRDRKEAEERFKEINEAYQVLGDEVTRREYDRLMGLTAKQGWEHGAEQVFSRRVTQSEILEDLLKGFSPSRIHVDCKWRRKKWGCARGYGRRRCRRFSPGTDEGEVP